MKLGTETGSMVNHLQARATLGEPTPEVGMGVTILLWTDRHAGTIQRIFEERGQTVLEVTTDKATLVSGSKFSEEQGYTFEPRPDGPKAYFKKRLDGQWREFEYKVIDSKYDEATDTRHETRSSRLSLKDGGHGLRVGERDEYEDPSF
jgi:hypothetical protein